MKKVLFLAALVLAIARPSAASTLTFEEVFLGNPNPPSAFQDALPPLPNVYNVFVGGVNFSMNGGVFLFQETSSSGSDATVFATASAKGDGIVTTAGNLPTPLQNPLVFTFSAPVLGFGLTLTNALSGAYLLVDNDNAANFVNLTIANTPGNFDGFTSGVLPFAAKNIRLLFVNAGDPCTAAACADRELRGWDFAVDSVSFTDAPSTVPEPGSLLLLGSGVSAFVAYRRRGRRA